MVVGVMLVCWCWVVMTGTDETAAWVVVAGRMNCMVFAAAVFVSNEPGPNEKSVSPIVAPAMFKL